MRNIQLTGNGAFIASGGVGPAEFNPTRLLRREILHAANSTRGAGKYGCRRFVIRVSDNPRRDLEISWYSILIYIESNRFSFM